jgi:hypothetical protein
MHRVERLVDVLRNPSNLPASEPGELSGPTHVVAASHPGELARATGAISQTDERTGQAGLSGARLPNEADHLSLGHAELKSSEHRKVGVIAEGEVLNL